MNMQEQFFKDQIRVIHESRNAKEEDFERIQQEEREKVKQSSTGPISAEEWRRKYENVILWEYMSKLNLINGLSASDGSIYPKKNCEKQYLLSDSKLDDPRQIWKYFLISHDEEKPIFCAVRFIYTKG